MILYDLIWFFHYLRLECQEVHVLVVEILKYKPFCCITARNYHNSQNKFPVSLCDYVRVSRGRILERNWDKSLKSFPLRFFSLLLTVTSTNGFYSPPFSKSGLKLVCNVNIIYGNLKSENSQNYALKPQRNCMFMNSASGSKRIKRYGH